jgi:hypothetical protein
MIRLRVFQVQGTPQLFVVRTTNRFRSSRCAITATKIVRLWQLHHCQGELLEQPKDFEDDHDNDDHSNYVKDVSAHAGELIADGACDGQDLSETYQHPSKIP